MKAVDDFLAGLQQLQPAGLLIEGEAGIGKTTMLAGVVDAARQAGFRVLSAHGDQSGSGLAHAAIADLFAGVQTDILDGLPELQRRAADGVLRRGDGTGGPTDERVIAAALLGAVHGSATRTPVLVAVDDVQWLDPSSVAVLAFVARRVKGRVGFVVAERPGVGPGLPAATWLQVGTGALTRLPVAPMSLGALHTMLSSRLGRRFSRPQIVRIAEVSGGNPLYALELARVADGAGSRPGQRLPESLSELVRLRVDGLAEDVRDVLLVAASATSPTVDLLAKAVGVTPAAVTGLVEAAEVEGIVVIDGNRIRFTHPVLANGIYAGADPQRRREVHRRLADLKTDPELRARHLALASTVADETTLTTLDAAADAARARGAPAAAAELLEWAMQLGGDSVSRRIRAAEHHVVAGDMRRAATLLEQALVDLRPGVLCAIALNLLARVRMVEDDYIRAVELLERARADADNDAVLVTTLLSLGFCLGMTGSFTAQLATVREAVAVAERAGVPALTSRALAMWVHVSFQAGNGLDSAALLRAVDLEDPEDNTPIPFRASAARGLSLALTGRLAEADGQLAAVAQRSAQRGAEQDVMAVLGYRTLVAIWRGRYAEADAYAADTMERAEQLGGSMVIAFSICAAVAAYRGREDQARDQAAGALAQGGDYVALTVWASATLAFLEVSRGNYEQALEAAEPLVDLYRDFPGTELMSACFMPDAIESLIAVGRLDEAEPLIAAFERNGAELDRPWQLAIGNRCRAMLLSATGDLDGALAAAERAMAEHARLPMPFERARSALTLGEVLRRLRRRDAAAAAVRDALAQFEELGVPLWVARARIALSGLAVSGSAVGSELTDSERRIAELAASGMSNRDVAETLFVSVKTIETNLSRVYRKLGIRSRAQLGRMLR
ncbi:AAA family ATPase [Mycolicibacterium gilvum]|uniref:AAA family ATPase n=1 Tax=Mycolicibacterium gilvum TaxID=1804 RepID=UPI0040458705